MLQRGFALVEAPPYLGDGLLTLRKSRMVLPFHSKRWWRFPQLARYGCWLERLLVRALPAERLSLLDLEFRHEPAGSVDDTVDRMHADGSYVRSVHALYGPGTVYRDGDVELPVPAGQTLLMTAMNRAMALRVPCTLHRRPGAGAERAVIVCSFEPGAADAQPPRVYRQAAHG